MCPSVAVIKEETWLMLVGRIDEGGRLLHIPGALVLHNLIEHPLK